MSLVQAQGGYGILGFRKSELKSPLTLNYIEPGFDGYYAPDEIESVSFNKESLVLGFGYQWIDHKKEYWNGGNPIKILYTNMDINSFDYIGYDHNTYSSYDESGTINNIDWCIGGGYGIKFKNGFSLSTNLEYTFTGIDEWDFTLPAENYLSLNLKIGFGTRTGIGHLGLYGTHYPNKYFINKSGPLLTSNEITAEIPYVIPLIGLMILGVAGGADVSGLMPSSSSSSSISGGRGCHVYGKIKFVEYGEDYKVKFVNYGENLKIKYVSYGADSPGEWKVVKYGEDFKVKIVKYGDDFKVKEVTYGQGCN